MTSEAAFARLLGVTPLPASLGKRTRHRLNREGDRQGNKALYMVIGGRMENTPRPAPTSTSTEPYETTS